MPSISQTNKFCSGCKRLLPIGAFYKYAPASTTQRFRYSWKCQSCVKKHRRAKNAEAAGIPKTLSPQYYLNHLRLKAKGRKGTASITTADLIRLWEAQGGKCALTGWQMTMVRRVGVVRTNASIDRIDSSKGYTLENIQLVCVVANKAKFDLNQEEFVKLCRSVLAKAARRGRNRRVSCRTKAKKTSRP